MSIFKFIQDKILNKSPSSSLSSLLSQTFNYDSIIIDRFKKRLNFAIFMDVLLYLIYYNLISFENVLNIALISKSTFKIVKNTLISFEFSKYTFLIENEDQLIKYIKFKSIKNKKLPDEKVYNMKLIQYRDIEYIKFKLPMDYNLYEGDENYDQVKLFLKQHCNNLKQVTIQDCFHVPRQSSSKTIFDYSQNGLYKFNWLMWENSMNQNYLQLLQPKKLFLFSPVPITTEDCDVVLKCTSIETFNFFSISTPDYFIDQVFKHYKAPQIKSLYLRVDPLKCNDIGLSLSANLLKLKKLILQPTSNSFNYAYGLRYSNTSHSTKELFEQIQTNETLNTIGLISYNIRNAESLIPLNTMFNVNTLYCDISVLTLSAHLDHCNQNPNITKLHIQDYFNSESSFGKSHMVIILNFLNVNTTVKNVSLKFNNRSYINLISKLEEQSDFDENTIQFLKIFNNNHGDNCVKYKHAVCKLKF